MSKFNVLIIYAMIVLISIAEIKKYKDHNLYLNAKYV
jgi:hypothetical protein